MKTVIIGGVAGGASAAARLRRLREKDEIIILERGDYVSYANCGLPYYIGGVITQKSALMVQTPESLTARLSLDVRVRQDVKAIDKEKKFVEIFDIDGNRSYTESYDRLVLAPGAEPVTLPNVDVDDERIFTLRTISDSYRIVNFIKKNKPKTAMIVGAGYIGLEMAENLSQIGIKVTVVEESRHVLAGLDHDVAVSVHRHLRHSGVELLLGNSVKQFTTRADGLYINLLEGDERRVDMVLVSIGVKPESVLAKNAGLEVNERGAVVVDKNMRTSDRYIYAVGDVVQVMNLISGKPTYVPLAGPANKQGRVAADNIAGFVREYKGSQGTGVLKLFDMTVGTTGLNEKAAKELGYEYDKIYLMTNSHAGYYPKAGPLIIKVLFELSSGKILGGQLVGFDGVDKRLDVLALAIRAGLTANDLAEHEHGYSPPYSSAKDPINMVGFMIQNLIEEQIKQFHVDQVEELIKQGHKFIDVRTPAEYVVGHIDGAVNIPVDELRGRIHEVECGKPLYIYCQSGTRSYIAARVLAGNGYEVSHLAGGYRLWCSMKSDGQSAGCAIIRPL